MVEMWKRRKTVKLEELVISWLFRDIGSARMGRMEMSEGGVGWKKGEGSIT